MINFRVNQAGAYLTAAFEHAHLFAGVPFATHWNIQHHNLERGDGKTAMATTRNGAGCKDGSQIAGAARAASPML